MSRLSDHLFSREYPEAAFLGELGVITELIECDKCNEPAEFVITFGIANVVVGATEVREEQKMGRTHCCFCLACLFGFLTLSLEKGIQTPREPNE